MTSARIANELRARIVSGQLKPGARVPSARQIMRKYGVANATAGKALSILIDEGLLRAIPGVGTLVEQGLSEARIVGAALAIADREGLAAVSIRRVASELRVSPMALYRYFPSKDELVLLLADAAFGESKPPAAREAVELRAQLEAAARAQWQVYAKHPWLAGAISLSRPQLLPNGMLHTEHVLGVFDGMGLSNEVMMRLTLTLIGYVRGSAVSLEAELQAEHETRLSREAYLRRQEAQFGELALSGQMPTLARVGGDHGLDLSLESLFEFGLARLLDGMVAFVQRERAPRARKR
jgi:AcrR family transcriptional regulator